MPHTQSAETNAPEQPLGLALHIIEDEPRVLDIDLAAELALTNERDIRTTIKSNLAELRGLGKLSAVPTVSGKRGPAAKAYHLNEAQALLVCMLSRTERAKQVRAEVIRVFTAWRHGHLAPATVPILDTDALKANAQLSASAAVGAAKNVFAPHARQIEGKVAHLDERLTEMAKWMQANRRETNAKVDAILTFITKPSAVALQFNDYIELGGVYEVAGVPPTVARRGILSANIRHSLDNYAIDQRVLPAHATVRGHKVRHWPKSLVADWLAAEGHALIERHARTNTSRPKIVPLDKPTE